MTTRRRLMVLGGGRHQIPLIVRAEQRGIEVVLVDYLSDAPARDVATHALLQDALDPAAAIAAGREYDIDGIVTTGTDLPVVTMAETAAALGLPCWITPEQARTATDKRLMHDALAAGGVPVASYRELGPDEPVEDAALALPVVVKPADSQGQRGVTRVTSAEQLAGATHLARGHSSSGRILVEEFLEGPEITANAWVQGDDVLLLAVNDRVTYNPPPHLGIAYQHVHPSRHAGELLDEIHSTLVRVAATFEMTSGPLYAQMIITPDGPTMVEVAARVGGGHESSMFPLITGSGVEDRLIDLALDGACEPFRYDMRHAQEPPHVTVTFVLGRAGAADVVPEMDDLPPGIVEGGWYIRPGARLQDVRDSLGRIGYFVAHGTDAAELDATISGFYRSLKVCSTGGDNLVLVPEERYVNR